MTSEGNTGQQPNARARAGASVWRPIFLQALALGGNVTLAAQQAGIDRATAYKNRARSREFTVAWEEALAEAVDRLEIEARRRAVTGVEEPVYYKGVVVGTVTKYSDAMLTLLLKAHRPEKFRERFEHTGADGGPIQTEQTIHHPDPETLAEILKVREDIGDVNEVDDENTASRA